MSKNIYVLGVVGSIRSNHKAIDSLKHAIEMADTQKELNQLIAQFDDTIFSNSDISLAHALLGAKKYGAKIELISITNIFAHNKLDIYYDLLQYDSIDDIAEIDSLQVDETKFQELLKEVDLADGIIMSTPVYFGDRSSIANKFLQLTYKYKALKHKAFGVVSVGAKRNGGQETTNIYTLQEAMMQEAIVVGNGPKTSQYGGTVWAGDIGTATSDNFGLETCFGVGRQVAQLSNILKLGKKEKDKKIKITFLITMDTIDKKYEVILQEYINKIYNDNIEIQVYNLINDTIYRCIACNLCPSPKMMIKLKEQNNPYHCVIQTQKDNMKQIQELLVSSDCIVFVGVNSHEDLIYRYQAFMERTRFIRHDDYELTNIPSMGMLINEVGATNNQIHNIKILTSFIRHNTFFLKPLEIILNKSINIFENSIEEYFEILQIIKNGRQKIDAVEVSYKATGYADKSLDSSKKMRR